MRRGPTYTESLLLTLHEAGARPVCGVSTQLSSVTSAHRDVPLGGVVASADR